MEEHSLEHVNPSQLKSFVRKLCIISSRYEKKQKAVENLDKHVDKLAKSKKIKKSDALSGLRSKIDEVLDAEKKIMGYRKSELSVEKDLKIRIENLEKDLLQARTERDKAVKYNRERIKEINDSLTSIKSKITEVADSKRERTRRLAELEQKISNKV
jgi:prefoldin subunit 5